MENAIRLLIIEDSEADALLVLNELERAGKQVEWLRAETEGELIRSLQEREWDIALGDYNLPGFSGMAALEAVRSHAPALPFIMMSGARGEEFAVEAMRAGADDFVTKDNLSRVVPVIERALAFRQERRARRRADEELRVRNRRLRLLSRTGRAPPCRRRAGRCRLRSLPHHLQ